MILSLTGPFDRQRGACQVRGVKGEIPPLWNVIVMQPLVHYCFSTHVHAMTRCGKTPEGLLKSYKNI